MISYTGRPGVDWGDIAQGMGNELKLREYQDTQAAQAIRWQGEQDYRTLIDSGVDPEEALRRTAPKLFHNDPRALASAIEGMGRKQERIDAVKQQNEWMNQRMTAQQTFYDGRSLAAQASQRKAAEDAQKARVEAAEAKAITVNLENEKGEVVGKETLSKQEWNQRQAAPLLKERARILKASEGENRQRGPDWLPFFATPHSKQLEENAAELFARGFDTTGKPIATGIASAGVPAPAGASAPAGVPAPQQGLAPLQKAAIAKLRANLTPENVLGFRKFFGASLTDIALQETSYVADAQARVAGSRTPTVTPSNAPGAVPPPDGWMPRGLTPPPDNFQPTVIPGTVGSIGLYPDRPVKPSRPLPSRSEIAALKDTDTHKAFALKFGLEALDRYLKYIK